MGLGTKPLVDTYSCQVGSEDAGSNSTLFFVFFFQNESKSTDSEVHEHNNSRTKK